MTGLLRRVPGVVVDGVFAAAALADALVSADPGWWPVGCAALAAGGLLVRRRLPYLTAVLALLGLFVCAATIAAVVAVYTLAAGRTPRPVLALVTTLGLIGQTLAFGGYPDTDPDVLDLVYSGLVMAGPVGLGLLVRARDELTGRVAELRAARAEAERTAAREAVARERAQLAREMHDVVSHQVSLIAVRAGALQVTTQDAEAVEAARDIRTLSVTTLQELRQMLGVLRTATPEGLGRGPQPRIADLPALLDGAGTPTTWRVDVADELAAPVQRAVYRTVQEGLTNARKHAAGSPVDVAVRQHAGVVEVVVENGAASAPGPGLPGAGHGLLGLGERAEMLDGVLEAGPTGLGGFRLRMTLPVHGGR